MTTATGDQKVRGLYDVHPAAELFPMMSDAELQGLAEDIHEHGLLEPIILLNGKILDGRNRYAACELAGIEPRFLEINDIASPTIYVLSRNLCRRHLTVGQRAAIAVDCLPLLHEEARKRHGGNMRYGSSPIEQEPDSKEVKGPARSIAAHELQVSETSLQRAVEVKRADPDEFERVRRGETTVHAAHQKVKGIQGPGKNTAARMEKAERVERIRDMAAEGYHADQISNAICVTAEHVRRLAQEAGIILVADSLVGKVRRRDINRIIEQTVLNAAGLIVGLELSEDDQAAIDKERLPGWIASLDESLAALKKFTTRIRKVCL